MEQFLPHCIPTPNHPYCPSGEVEMLLSFEIENYRSIGKLVLDFSFAEKSAPRNYQEKETLSFIGEENIRVVPCLALFGPNASGKSNILRAMQSLQNIVKGPFEGDEYDPNRQQDFGPTTHYRLKFLSDRYSYTYDLSHDGKQLLEESLSVDETLVYSIRENKITDFSQEGNHLFKSHCLDSDDYFHTPFLSAIGQGKENHDKRIIDAFDYMTNRMEISRSSRFTLDHCVGKLAFSKGKDALQAASKRIVQVLRKLDIDITRLDFNIGGESNTNIVSFHQSHRGGEYWMDFDDESEGTKRLVCLLGVMLSALEQGHVLVVDELDNSIHPMLFVELVRLFKEKRYNSHNAQLIFTTHNTDIMDRDLMRISEIAIVGKNSKRGTTIARISDFEGIENVTKFRKLYLQGRFSGIPYPYI